ncbi:hypothetical protein [Escherichia coli]|uniref:hypothetical protein n=1 Tax=Escherichia coli TaxID=562 RepID=UPI000F935E0A|nr:hypothetical protein [Escherichia coli]MCF7295872.1 hypothetical protein [Escherichia coli]MHZ52209.1 hypothetical protein [Escherichia coli]HAY0358805.1 hypothetical protein [Escherichia coli]HAY0391476.1 hypothetical protein [Escherichia coli]
MTASATGEKATPEAVYRCLAHRVVTHCAFKMLNGERSPAKAKRQLINGLESLRQVAAAANDYPPFFMINEMIEQIKSGKSIEHLL